MISITNPAGLWALLGIPAVLAIHFLQRQAVTIPISTLFLLEKTQRESASGRRLDRLMNSVPLWMQLLGVLLLAWLLSEPRYQKARSTQRVAIVLDSSASMSVVKDQLIEEITEALPDIQGAATALEVTLLESTPGRPRLYSGASVEDLRAALEEWRPRTGLMDPAQALRLARSLVSREGIVIYATDTPIEAPFDARILAVGEEIENVGFTGVSIVEKEGQPVWQALVRNYSKNRSSRTWQLEMPNGAMTEPKTFDIDPNGFVTLQAAFPDGADRVQLVLSPDDFTLDDFLPMVVPQPKKISIFSATGGAYEELAKKLQRSLDSTVETYDATDADLTILSYDPLDPVQTTGNAIVFVRDDTRGGAYLKGGIISSPHPLIDALNWQSLLVRETIQLQRRETDNVLLWQGSRPLIFLREKEATADSPASRQLCFNFDLRLSNAATQPAFIVMLHRFSEQLRASKVAPATEMLESGQPIELAASADPEAPALTLKSINLDGKTTATDSLPASLRVKVTAPLDSGFLNVSQGESELLDASVYFADTREADFSACAKDNTLSMGSAASVERHTEEDHWWRAWFLLLLLALLISWHFTRERAAKSPAGNQTLTPQLK